MTAVRTMLNLFGDVDIPNRALFKAAEVCDIVKVQPYVLRSWEAEFPALGVAKAAGGPRVYRRRDVEQVARIKRLLLVDGLTLAGARRKLEEETAPVGADAPGIDELIGQNARERLTTVKRGLRSILELLASSSRSPRAPAPQMAAQASDAPTLAARGGKSGRDKGPASPPGRSGRSSRSSSSRSSGSSRSTHAGRKRSA